MSQFLSFDRHLLPPITALRAFEAAARLGSFTVAADELHLTQGAISRQVRLLEDQIGVALFLRVRQRIILTEAGHYYADHVRDALSRLMAAGVQTVSFAALDSKLHIGIIPTFCSRWIVPRLPDFLERNPRLQVCITAIGRDMDFVEEEFDAVLIVGAGDWTNTVSHCLASEELVPVAAPKYAHRFGIQSPKDLIGPSLLQHTARPDMWTKWFAHNGIDAGALVPARLALEQITMIVEAAIAQLGIALLPRVLVARELESGVLVELPGKSLLASEGYFLVYSRHKENYPPLQSFRSWLLATV